MRQYLQNLFRSVLFMMFSGFVLALVLILIEIRLQVSAYWETHPEEWRTMKLLEARDPGAADFLVSWRAQRQKSLERRNLNAAVKEVFH